MGMQSVGILDNNKIIAQSVNKAVPKPERKSENQKDGTINKSFLAEHKMFAGAAAIASIVIAGILIAKGKKSSGVNSGLSNISTSENSQTAGSLLQSGQSEAAYSSGMKLKFDSIAQDAENNLRKKITAFFTAFRDGKEMPKDEDFPSKIGIYKPIKIDFNSYLDFRMKNVRLLNDKKLPADLREMDPDDVDAVLEFIKNYGKYNIPLRNGENLSKVDEVSRLNRLIEEALPLEEDTYVLRGVRTRNLHGDFSKFDFDELNELEIGDTIIDKAFVSTARTYDAELASVDPLLLAEPFRNSGYIMRIKLPKGTKGFDCRRLTQMDSDKGVNSTFILPSDSEFKITGWDAPRRILDCEYVLT